MSFLKSATIKQISDFRSACEAIRNDLEELRDEKQDYIDERSDKWREGDAGEAFSEKISELEELIQSIEAVEQACDPFDEDKG